jgi:hypothetical protein
MSFRTNLSGFKVPELKSLASSVGIKGAGKLKKENLLSQLRAVESSRLNMAINSHKRDVAKAMFIEQGTDEEHRDDGDDVAADLISSDNDASTLMLSILSERDRAHVKKVWKDLVSQQVSNGSFLEFQGMRFMTDDAVVYDVERLTKGDAWASVMTHILQKPPPGKYKVYLKCKFPLSDVNSDTTPIQNNTTMTWKDLFTKKLAKGQAHCEPDVIIRTDTEVRIFEMKMGLGKYDTVDKASEANQLARGKKVFENFIDTYNVNLSGNVRQSNIKLFFVGWSAPSNEAAVFTGAPWSFGEYAVTKINGMGMTRYAPINSEIVTKIITMLNVMKLENFYKAAGIIFKKWGPYYNNWKAWKSQQYLYIARESNKFGKAFNAPPEVAVAKPKTAKEAATAKAVEEGVRGKSRNVRQMAIRQVKRPAGNASSNSNNENARVRRFNWVMRHTSNLVKRQRLVEQLSGNNLRALAAIANARRVAQMTPINARILGLVNKNAANWDVTYSTFIRDHTVNIPNAANRINKLLKAPPPGKEANFANKLMKKQGVNRRATRPSLVV